MIRSNILLSPVDFVDMFGSVCVFLRNALPLSNTINERKKWFLSAPRLCDHRVRRVVVPQPQRTSYIEKNRWNFFFIWITLWNYSSMYLMENGVTSVPFEIVIKGCVCMRRNDFWSHFVISHFSADRFCLFVCLTHFFSGVNKNMCTTLAEIMFYWNVWSWAINTHTCTFCTHSIHTAIINHNWIEILSLYMQTTFPLYRFLLLAYDDGDNKRRPRQAFRARYP